jgi:hypothetical protein
MTTIAKCIISAALAARVLPAAAQVSYIVLEKDPEKYKRTVLYLDLINCDTYNDISVGYAFKLETVVANRLMPWVQVKRSWLDLAATHAVSGYPEAIGGLEKQSITDIGGVLFLRNKNKQKNLRVVLRSSSHRSGDYVYTHTKYVSVPGEIKKMFGLRGGIFINNKVLQLDGDAHARFRYRSIDGLTDVPIEDVGVFTSVQPAGEAYKPLPLMHAASMYFGLHKRSVTNMQLRVEGYGRRANARVTDAYFDIMYAPSVSVSNVRDAAGQEWQIVPQAGAIRHLGWRAGVSTHTSRAFNLQYSCEFGVRPGAIVGSNFMGNGTYITIAMGVTIGSGKYLKLKSKHESKTSEKE